MADLVMVVTMVAFVLLCVAYVDWCNRIIVRDEGELAVVQAEDESVAGPSSPVARAEVTA
jgi:hypothetical protein